MDNMLDQRLGSLVCGLSLVVNVLVCCVSQHGVELLATNFQFHDCCKHVSRAHHAKRSHLFVRPVMLMCVMLPADAWLSTGWVWLRESPGPGLSHGSWAKPGGFMWSLVWAGHAWRSSWGSNPCGHESCAFVWVLQCKGCMGCGDLCGP